MEDMLNTICDMIRQSKEYVDYHRELAVIKENTELYARVCDYRKKCISIQMSGSIDSFDEAGTIRNQYEDVLGNMQAVAFLTSEQKLIKLTRKINNRIYDEIGMDIDFLDE